jgi:MFS superfamily sulfate permease-like transporter
MAQKEIDEEVQIIIQNAQSIDISSQEDLVAFVRIVVAASDRFLNHISNLVDGAVIDRDHLTQLNQSIESLTQTSQQLAQNVQSVSESTNQLTSLWPKILKRTTSATRLGIAALLILLVAAIAYFWKLIPPEYIGNIIYLVIGTILIPISHWIYKSWNA